MQIHSPRLHSAANEVAQAGRPCCSENRASSQINDVYATAATHAEGVAGQNTAL